MKQITDFDGYPDVFKLERSEVGLWLGGDWANPDSEWRPNDKFVFCFRKQT